MRLTVLDAMMILLASFLLKGPWYLSAALTGQNEHCDTNRGQREPTVSLRISDSHVRDSKANVCSQRCAESCVPLITARKTSSILLPRTSMLSPHHTVGLV